MTWWRKLQLRFRALFQKRKLDAEMDEEMRPHIEMQTQGNIDAGANPEEARWRLGLFVGALDLGRCPGWYGPGLWPRDSERRTHQILIA